MDMGASAMNAEFWKERAEFWQADSRAKRFDRWKERMTGAAIGATLTAVPFFAVLIIWRGC
jgi:hypothetical protein